MKIKINGDLKEVEFSVDEIGEILQVMKEESNSKEKVHGDEVVFVALKTINKLIE